MVPEGVISKKLTIDLVNLYNILLWMLVLVSNKTLQRSKNFIVYIIGKKTTRKPIVAK